MPKLLFTIGPPRSGKSTFCTQWASLSPNRVIVCGDSIRESLGFEFCQHNETLVQGIKDLMIRSLLIRGQDVIVDGTHSTINSIQRMFTIDANAEPSWFPSYHIYTEPRLVELVRLRCHNRGLKTKGEYIIPVIDRIVDNITKLVQYGEDLKCLLKQQAH